MRVLDLLQDADLHVIDHQRHPLRIACIFERLRNVQAVDAFHVLTPNEILRSGPAAFRKYAPGLTSRAVSAPSRMAFDRLPARPDLQNLIDRFGHRLLSGLCYRIGYRLNDFLEIVGLSIGVSLAATAIAAGIGVLFGAALAIFAFPGRQLVIVLINALFGLPPVVVGLVLYLALSRSGPLGSLELLFTPTAMVIAQTILAAPIITALVHRASERAWARYGDELVMDGATRLQPIPQILMIIRADVVTAVLAGFGRTVSEVGAVILVGGNIRGLTRTMTTAIALQTSQGDLSLALALGIVLVGISISISATVFALAGRARTAGSDEV
ncbi:ABC-type tungstate transport system, substrate-binding protein [Bradyrhizobium erythrophlei]|uniref:ABC-type tungstate transport system, substrate-binding protein n=1 Tax=Bradyrhizobium erythrophlei TaxID=1437360 RepID=A0A1M7TD99_9BRAD|nr:ABC-type tungstate transport system, substrate-binding protein [Bradyrhizobium erythrophlei]